MARWISLGQQKRDHSGNRDYCAACGHQFTARNPMGLDDEGWRVCVRHFTDPNSGLYGKAQ
jgi:hypothetical protein